MASVNGDYVWDAYTCSMERMMKIYRQGDVLVVGVQSKNEMKTLFGRALAFTKKSDFVLAEGEVTGHSHVLKGECDVIEDREASDNVVTDVAWGQFVARIVVAEEAELVHEEHDTITIPPGEYIVVRQREYTPTGARRVFD